MNARERAREAEEWARWGDEVAPVLADLPARRTESVTFCRCGKSIPVTATGHAKAIVTPRGRFCSQRCAERAA